MINFAEIGACPSRKLVPLCALPISTTTFGWRLLQAREKEEFQYDAGGMGKQDQQRQRSLMAPTIHLI